MVALTFDDGPSRDDLEPVLDALDRAGVPGTFYIVGEQAAKNPGALEALVAAGHELGNHSWDHRRLVAVTPGTVEEEITSTDEVIAAAGQEGPITFRPPNAKKLVVLPLWLAQYDRTTVMWDVEVDEFSETPTPEDLAAEAAAQVTPGSIILLHPWYGRERTRQAIGPLVEQLRAQGYSFVTVSDLLSRES